MYQVLRLTSLLGVSSRAQISPSSSSLFSSSRFGVLLRGFSAQESGNTEGEIRITQKLTKAFEPTAIEVKDISGGCGSMYQIFIESAKFKGTTMVKQHRMVNECLKEDIKDMHGLRIHTVVSK